MLSLQMYRQSQMRKIAHTGTSAAAIAIALLSLAPSPACAQASPATETPAGAGNEGLGDIVVTARRVSESLQKVPMSIGAVTAERLENIGVRSVIDLDSKVPSLVFGSDSVRLQPFVGVRGVGDFSRNPGFDNRAGIYLDGVFLGRSSTTEFPVYDIERVEVLRGPQGTLFGKDSLTGVISITSAKPKFEESYRGTLRFGSRSLIEANGYLNTAISDTLAMRISLAAQSQDGYYRNLFNGVDLGSRSNVAGRLQLRFQPTASTTFDFAFDATHSRSDLLLGGRPLTGPGVPGLVDYQVNFNRSPSKDRSIYGVSLNVEHEFSGGQTLTSITAYRRSSSDLLGNDFDLSPQDQGGNFIYDRDHSFTQEVRLASPGTGFFSYVIGGFYFSGTPSWNWLLTLGQDFASPAIRGGRLTIDASVKQEIIAGFGRVTIRPTDWLSVDGGLRYSKTTKTIAYSQDPGALAALGYANVPLYTDSISSNTLSPLLSVSVAPTKSINLYAVYSTGERPGGYNADLTTNNNFQFGGIRFGGESVKNYEIGLKTQLFDNRVRFNVAAYRMKFDNFQVSQLNSFTQVVNGVPTVFRYNSVTNAAKVTSEGIEIDFEAAPVHGLNISGGIGINKARFDSFPNAFLISAGPPPVFGNYDGNSLIEAPRFTASVTAAYGFNLNDDWRMNTSLSYTYRGRTTADPSNGPNFAQEESNLVNGRISLGKADDRLEVAVFAKNLFAEKYIQAATTSGLGFAYQVLNEPRVIGIEFTIRK